MNARRALVSALLVLAAGCSSSDPAQSGDAGTSADGATSMDECLTACYAVQKCGYKTPFGCGDWCQANESVFPCLSKAKTCDDVCTCRGDVVCPVLDAGGDSASDSDAHD